MRHVPAAKHAFPIRWTRAVAGPHLAPPLRPRSHAPLASRSNRRRDRRPGAWPRYSRRYTASTTERSNSRLTALLPRAHLDIGTQTDQNRSVEGVFLRRWRHDRAGDSSRHAADEPWVRSSGRSKAIPKRAHEHHVSRGRESVLTTRERSAPSVTCPGSERRQHS